MAIDPTGTKPGLPVKPADEIPTVNMKCRRDGCTSILAIEVKQPAGFGRKLYRCVKCHHPASVMVGGSFNIG